MPDDLQRAEAVFFKRFKEDQERFKKLTPKEQEAETRRRKAAATAAVISAI
jgi:hypothetical protein